MRWRDLLRFGPLLLLALPVRGQPEPGGLSLPVQPQQIILVVTKDWQAVEGQLQRFEFGAPSWQPVGEPIQVVAGRSGMGWGRGLHPLPQTGPQKKEGDGKSPAGIFALLYTFGYEPPEKMAGLRMPYLHCTRALECVDDPKSSHYNQIMERPTNGRVDWNSSEKMLMTNNQYRLGIVIEHNTAPTEPGAGSCVFMHIWLGPGIGTSGCTAMKEGDIETLLGWLDARSHPMLVQLPEAEYRRLKKPWHLPEWPAPAPATTGEK